MAAYEAFAWVYDLFMDNVPYDEWEEYLTELLAERGITDGIVLDLACGTGVMTERFARRGFDMIGVDASAEMLDKALEKRDESGSDILYLQQDMTSFELYGTVRAVLCLCDSVNYLLTEEELLQTFRLVNNYLDPGGCFIFDMNTVAKYRDQLGGRTFAENRDEGSFIWENEYDEETGINTYDLTLYIACDEEDSLFERSEEVHRQRAYPISTVARLLEEAGLTLEKVYGDASREPGTEACERVFFVARERTKKKVSESTP